MITERYAEIWIEHLAFRLSNELIFSIWLGNNVLYSSGSIVQTVFVYTNSHRILSTLKGIIAGQTIHLFWQNIVLQEEDKNKVMIKVLRQFKDN